MTDLSQIKAFCQAPANSCGFRTRAWRKGQRPAKQTGDRLICYCGSEMKLVKTNKLKD